MHSHSHNACTLLRSSPSLSAGVLSFPPRLAVLPLFPSLFSPLSLRVVLFFFFPPPRVVLSPPRFRFFHANENRSRGDSPTASGPECTILKPQQSCKLSPLIPGPPSTDSCVRAGVLCAPSFLSSAVVARCHRLLILPPVASARVPALLPALRSKLLHRHSFVARSLSPTGDQSTVHSACVHSLSPPPVLCFSRLVSLRAPFAPPLSLFC